MPHNATVNASIGITKKKIHKMSIWYARTNENNTRNCCFIKLKQIELFYNGAHLLCLFSSVRRVNIQ